MAVKRVVTPEFVFEENIAGIIVRGGRDPQTGECYIDVTDEQEAEIRRRLIDRIAVRQQEVVTEHTRGVFSATGSESSSAVAGSTATHTMTVADAIKAIAQESNIAALEAMSESEAAHPQYRNGRRGVLEAVRQRIAELQPKS